MRKIYVFFYFLFIVTLQKTYLKRENKISSLLKNYYVEKTKIYFTIFLFSLFNFFIKAQDYIPIEIKSGFNADVIANGVGGALTSTTHDVDGVSFNFVSRDFQLTSTSTPLNYGLPVNRIIDSQISSTPGLAYKMAPYDGLNDLRLSSIGESSTLGFQSGIKVTDFFLLVTSGSGNSIIDIEVNFSDGSSQVFENSNISDWYGGSNYAIQGIGRISRNDNILEASSINPRLYQLKLSLLDNNYNKQAKSITITKKGGSGIPNIFAVSANQYDTCGSIKNLSTNLKDFSSVEIAWDALQNPPISGYDYYITNGDEIPTSETIPTGNVKTNKTLINSLTNGETYNFWIRSNCGANEKGFWKKITFIAGEASVTYDNGDISTSYVSSTSSTVTTSTPTECPGILSLEVPKGFRIKNTKVSYQMEAQTGAFMSEQRSLLVCKTNNVTEEEISLGRGSTGGTYSYDRNISIANGLTGKVEFELRAWRTWGILDSVCDSSYNKVTNGTWKIAVALEPIVITPDSNNILYVKKDGSGNQDGSSWDNAIGELADALKWANDENKKNLWTDSKPLKIYVSKGTYLPLYSPEDGENYGKDGGRNNTFLMVDNVELYGGFDPDNNIKTLDDKRIIPDGKNAAPNGTILSGDFNDNDKITGSGKTLEIKNNIENAYHVVTGINENLIYLFLDGFTIKGGNANQNSEIRVNAQTVHRDRGAGIYFRSSDSSAILNLKNVDVTYNQTTANGGGVYNESSNNSFSEINIKQSRISNNIGRFGAGIHSYSFKSKSEVKIFNSIIYNNSSVENGGGIYSYSYSSFSVSLVNSSLSGNTSTNGSGVYSLSSSSSVNLINSNLLENKGNSVVYFDRGNNNQLKIHNSIIYGNKKLDDTLFTNSRELYGGMVPTGINLEYKNSYIQGITSTDNGNIDGTLDPLFTNVANEDYSLQQSSPLVNKGNNSLYTEAINTDLANNPRLFDGTIDIGAYESQSYQAPKIINVTSTTDNGLYGIGKDITITVEFNKTVNVDTTNDIPKLLLETGLVDRNAEYISGTGTNTLTFIYNIQQGDLNEDLEYNSTSSLSLNGSTIKGSSGIDAVLSLPEPKEKGSLSANKNIVIDGVRPVVVSIKRLNDSPTNAANVSFEVTFSEPVSGVDISDFTLTTIGSASGNIASVTAVDDKYTLVVNSIFGQGEIRLDLKPSGTGIMDVAENLIANGFNSGETYEIDLVAPAMPTDFVGVGGDEEVNLSWNANTEDDFKQYNLFVLIEGTKTFLATIPSGTETYKHIGLNNNTSYTYYISAEDNLGNKSSEATTSATTFANQIITFNPLQNIIYGDEIELSATSSSNLDVEYKSSDTSVSEVYQDSNGKWKLKANSIGNVTITAIQSGNNTYLPAANVSQILTINPAIITITAEPKSKNYAEIDPELTYSVSGLVNDDIQSDILSGSLQREIGEDVGTYEIQKGTLSVTSNYSLVFVNNYLEITKATISGISFSDNSFVYDGNPKSLSIVGSLPSGATVSYTNNNQTNTGRYLVTASIDGGVNYEDFTLTANLEITKATISGISFSDNSFVYDGSPKSLSIVGSLPSGATVSYTNNNQTNAGTYLVTASIDGGVNYEDFTLTANLEITKATISGISFSDNSFMYDGSPKSLSIVGSLPSGVTVSYTNNNQTNAGIYLVTASIDGGVNYEDFTLTANLEITKATISGISFSDNSFMYDGSPKSLSIVGSLPSGVTVSYTNNNQTNAGTYLVTANIDGGVNYEDFTLTANLEITKANQTISWNQSLVVGCGGESSIELTATSSSGLPIIYQSSNESIVRISGNQAILVGGGYVEITAIQLGNNNYNAASPLKRGLTNKLNGMIKQKWNDVLIFDNSSNLYTKWQWYKDGKQIVGATKQVYNSSSPLSGEYYVVVTDGNEIETCPINITATQIHKGGLRIVPNPARQGEYFSLFADYELQDLVGAKIIVTDITGKQYNEINKVDVETKIQAPLTAGVYVVHLFLNNGKKSSTKLLVK